MTAPDRDPRETLEHIRKQADAATEGPWEADTFSWRPHPLPPSEWLGIEATGAVMGEVARIQLSDGQADADAAFIAASRTNVPWLLDQVELRDKILGIVMELHRPVEEEVIPWECGEGDCGHEDDDHPLNSVSLCEECYRLAIEVTPYYGEDGCADVLWPCPTVTAITRALEGDTHD